MSLREYQRNRRRRGQRYKPGQRRVIVCAGTGCVANGAYKVFEALARADRGGGACRVTTEFRPEDDSTTCV